MGRPVANDNGLVYYEALSVEHVAGLKAGRYAILRRAWLYGPHYVGVTDTEVLAEAERRVLNLDMTLEEVGGNPIWHGYLGSPGESLQWFADHGFLLCEIEE